jgi:aminopeptidase N
MLPGMKRPATLSRLFAFALAAALAAVGCSDPAPMSPDPGPETTATSTPRQTTAATTQPPSTAAAPTAVEPRLGLGDSRYPGLGNGGYDVAHYTVDLTYDPQPNMLNALVTIEATATEALDAFSLDFIGFDITALEVNGTAATFDRAEDELIIQTPRTLAAGESFETRVAYSGTPQPIVSEAIPIELGWRIAVDGDAYVVAEPDAGRTWLPLNDHPSDKATYTFMITVPDPLIAAANGDLVEQITDLGWSTWVWESPDPMASYLATVVIGDLMIVEDPASSVAAGVKVRNVLPPDLADPLPTPLATQGEMITFLSELFGPYPFGTYGIAVVDGFESALENQTLSIFGRDLVGLPEFFETVLIHELAHQWFGNSVTPADWGDIWLNEGFATYAEWLWIERQRGTAALQATVEGERNRLALTDVPPPGNPPPDDLFNISVYNWGGLTLHALRLEVGDDAFFEIMRTYVAEHSGSVVRTADFIAIAETVAGTDLSRLFDAWLFSETIPDFPTDTG